MQAPKSPTNSMVDETAEQARSRRAAVRRGWTIRVHTLQTEPDDAAFVAGGPEAGLRAVCELSRRMRALHPDGDKPLDRSAFAVRRLGE